MSADGARGEPERAVFVGARVRPQPLRNVLHGVLVGLLAACAAGVFAFAGWQSGLVWVAAAMLPFLGLLAWQRGRTPRGGGRIEASAAGLFADGALLVPRQDMTRAVVMRSEAGAVVSIQRQQGFFVAVDVPSEGEGQRLVSSLGLSADQRAAEFLVDSPLATYVPFQAVAGSLAAVLGLSVVGMVLGVLWPLLGMAPWCLFLLAWLHPRTLTIGTDGVLVRWLGRNTLIRFSEIVAVVPEPGGLRFELSGSRTVRIRARLTAAQRSKLQPELASPDVYMSALAARIQEARDSAGGPDVAVLDRRERSLSDWIRHLRGLTDKGSAGFRSAPVVEEALWRTVENGHAEPPARAAAAVALGPSLDDRGRERLRVAAGVVAAPKLRVALSAAADGDEEALSAALADIEAASPAPRKIGRVKE